MVGDYSGICQKPYQFICWNKSEPSYASLSVEKQIPFRELAQAQIAAEQEMTGKGRSNRRLHTHYYPTTMPKPPAWTAKAKQTLKLDDHVFYKDVP